VASGGFAWNQGTSWTRISGFVWFWRDESCAVANEVGHGAKSNSETKACSKQTGLWSDISERTFLIKVASNQASWL
jgi:hypothetical protein